MPMNTPYLGTPLSGENYTTSLGTTVLSDLSISGTLETGAVESAGAVQATTYAATSTSGFSYAGGSGNTDFGGFFSGQTSGWGSTTSLALADQEFSIVSLSATSCILAYRSGSTVYKFFARQAEGLSTTP